MTTDNQRLINLCRAIDEFHCEQSVKDRAYLLFGITTKDLYVHPAQRQMDLINKQFHDK